MYRTWIVKLTSRARSVPSACTPARNPTRRPAPSSRRSTRRPRTCRTSWASTRATNTAAPRIRRAWRSNGTSRAIEGGKAGFAFASGMAAIGAIATLLKAGDHVIVSDNTYGGTFRLFDKVLTRYQIAFSYVDTSKLDEVERAMTPSTRIPVRRDADQPGDADHGLARRRRPRAPARGPARRRQHLREPLRPAPDRVRRRHRHAQHDQIPQRPQRQRRRQSSSPCATTTSSG